ncbi:PaaI family thioesterase [Caulobacter sp. KR2-114]|uniref:PaaI family thioesterase n=1 Tax=Caulobacter sp. KR2-114 TaxID=3400912 RepID=UPI003C128744
MQFRPILSPDLTDLIEGTMGWDGAQFVEWFKTRPDSFFRKQPLSAQLNEAFEELDGDRGFVRIGVELGPLHCNYSGKIHGGIISLILDEAVGIASFIHVGEKFKSTIETKTSYFRPLKPGAAVVEAWVSHRTPSILFLEGQVLTSEGAVAAKCMSTIALSSAG